MLAQKRNDLLRLVTVQRITTTTIHAWDKGRSGIPLNELGKTHANSNRICAVTEQKDRGGCGACQLAAVYRTRIANKNPSNGSQLKTAHTTVGQSNKTTPQGTGVLFYYVYTTIRLRLRQLF